MFRFKIAQKIVEICGIRIGGNPGENPPVLIGTIFYHGHKIVVDERKGEFIRDEAEKLIKSVEEYSDKTKLPAMIDVTSGSPEAMVKYIDFVTGITKLPVLVDAPSIDIMREAFRYVDSSGLNDRVIYNSLTYRSKDDEYNILREYKIRNAIALLYTDKILDINSRINALETISRKAKEFQITNLLVDTFVIDIPSLAIAVRTGLEIKTRYGYPWGCGAHNATSAQRKAFKERFGREGLVSSELSANLIPIVMGSDFLLYGPIEKAKEIFPAVYIVYTSYRYLLRTKTSLIELA